MWLEERLGSGAAQAALQRVPSLPEAPLGLPPTLIRHFRPQLSRPPGEAASCPLRAEETQQREQLRGASASTTFSC